MTTEKKTGRKKIGYKVVRKIGKHYYSAVAGTVEKSCRAQRYIIDTPAKQRRGYGPLAVFTNPGSALHFRRCMGTHLEVWECDYTPTQGKRALWYPKGPQITGGWAHTRYAQTVTLVRRII